MKVGIKQCIIGVMCIGGLYIYSSTVNNKASAGAITEANFILQNQKRKLTDYLITLDKKLGSASSKFTNTKEMYSTLVKYSNYFIKQIDASLLAIASHPDITNEEVKKAVERAHLFADVIANFLRLLDLQDIVIEDKRIQEEQQKILTKCEQKTHGDVQLLEKTQANLDKITEELKSLVDDHQELHEITQWFNKFFQDVATV